jgi:hypothetical protein
VLRELASRSPTALWLSGSAARHRLRRRSDIDWVLVTESSQPVADLPARHSIQVFTPAQFTRRLAKGSEFIVWQLAYGQAIVLDSFFKEGLRSTVIAPCKVAAAMKRKLIAKRLQLTDVLARCASWSSVERNLVAIAHQEARALLLELGVVPGCRVEVLEQLSLVSSEAVIRWRKRIDQLFAQYEIDSPFRNILSQDAGGD